MGRDFSMVDNILVLRDLTYSEYLMDGLLLIAGGGWRGTEDEDNPRVFERTESCRASVVID